MERDRLHYLMQRYFAQECTPEEKEELALFIDATKNDELKSQLLDQWDNYDSKLVLSEDKAQNILRNIKVSTTQTKRSYPKPMRRILQLRTIAAIAASVLLLFSLGIFLQKSNSSTIKNIVAKASTVPPQKQTSFTRNVTLPDGSTVVLHAGSTINYPSKFTAKTREIALVGEAYFDIKHDSKRPFIIHTGKVRTTVLGTAFDIKAWPEQKSIIVSVMRGKVRVENENKVLAVLTINQQISYNLQNAAAKHQKVNTEEIVTNWAKQDLNFDGATLEAIAQTLSKRYGKNININNLQLAQTQIVSSFVGTESLENILDILCTVIPNAQFIEKNNEITISAKN